MTRVIVVTRQLNLSGNVTRPVPFKVIESTGSFEHEIEKDLDILADRAILRFKDKFPEFKDADFYKDIIDIDIEDV